MGSSRPQAFDELSRIRSWRAEQSSVRPSRRIARQHDTHPLAVGHDDHTGSSNLLSVLCQPRLRSYLQPHLKELQVNIALQSVGWGHFENPRRDPTFRVLHIKVNPGMRV